MQSNCSRLSTLALICAAMFAVVNGESGTGKKLDLDEMYKNPLSHGEADNGESKANFDPGFGDDIEWVPWENAIETALDSNKPIFLLIHKTWCHACKSLRKVMQQSNARKAFKKLSEYFVMVNTADDDEPYEEEYRPDGKYVPRLLFLDKNGDHLANFKNKKAEYKNYAHYYSSPADILNSMKDVIAHYGIEVPEMRKGDKLKPVKPPAPPKEAPDAPEAKKAGRKPPVEEEEAPKEAKEAEDKKETNKAEKSTTTAGGGKKKKSEL